MPVWTVLVSAGEQIQPPMSRRPELLPSLMLQYRSRRPSHFHPPYGTTELREARTERKAKLRNWRILRGIDTSDPRVVDRDYR